ncbi:MAG: NERD domain-containing protein [Chloroflexota bacterium]|nr:NERD domain-containing protein [Chloroflexota bacterium]
MDRAQEDRRLGCLDERRKGKRETQVKERWGDRLGGLILALSDEKQSTTAWRRGAAGKVKLARAIGETAGIHLLNDRCLPRDKRNIDHIIVSSGGVLVVDAKKYKGMVRLRNKGWFFRPDERLFVGGRDCSKLADGMAWQVEAVRSVLLSAGVDPLPPITPVLCFIDADWPIFGAPNRFRGVLLEAPGSLRKRIVKQHILTEADVERVVRTLATALPTK